MYDEEIKDDDIFQKKETEDVIEDTEEEKIDFGDGDGDDLEEDEEEDEKYMSTLMDPNGEYSY